MSSPVELVSGSPPLLAGTHLESDFGAVPDYGQDDTAAILAALEAARANSDPVVLEFFRGCFILTTILTSLFLLAFSADRLPSILIVIDAASIVEAIRTRSRFCITR